MRASLSVNAALLSIYWEVGNTIIQQQKSEGWGSKVIDRLALDLKSEFPEMQGLSLRNIKYMRAFAEAYPNFLIVQQAAAQLGKSKKNLVSAIEQHPAAQLPWTHNQVILDKLKNEKERIFYITKTYQNGWSRNILAQQIDSKLHLRQGTTINNFERTLALPQSDLAKETLKNPYMFDSRPVRLSVSINYLSIGTKFSEIANKRNIP